MMFGLIGTKEHPKGPDWKAAHVHGFNLSGTRLSFTAPMHTDVSVSPDVFPSVFNLYDQSHYKGDPEVPGDFPRFTFFRQGWSFYGLPVVHGRLGDLSLALSVVLNTERESLFNNRAFEKAMIDRLNVDRGPGSGIAPDERRFRCPLNWGSAEVNGATYVHYDVLDLLAASRIHTEWLTPLTDDRFLVFTYTRHAFRQDARCCQEAFLFLINKIMSSVRIELSPEAQQQKADAERRWPEAKHSEHMPELEWPEYEQMEPRRTDTAYLVEKAMRGEDPFAEERTDEGKGAMKAK